MVSLLHFAQKHVASLYQHAQTLIFLKIGVDFYNDVIVYLDQAKQHKINSSKGEHQHEYIRKRNRNKQNH